MSIVHNRIKERRKASGKTLLQVANFLHVKEATAQRYESGSIKQIKYETIVALADFFACSPSYLMGWTDDLGCPQEEPYLTNDNPEAAQGLYQAYMQNQGKQMGLVISHTDPQLAQLLECAKGLNAQGIAKLIDYTQDLSVNPKYQRNCLD